MSGDSLPEVPTADDFRALARSSPWRFTTVHFTHRRQLDAGSTPDGLVARRPEDWHYDHGDPMWQDYRWTAMLDPAELSQGVDVSEVVATTLRGRLTWSAACRPLLGAGEDRENGYTPRCGCCPLLDSPASRILEYGREDPTLTDGDLATVYRVHLDVQTSIVVDITPLDGLDGTSLSNEIHAVDALLDPPQQGPEQPGRRPRTTGAPA